VYVCGAGVPLLVPVPMCEYECLYLCALRAGSGVVRIDPFLFLDGWRKRRLNHAPSALSLYQIFFEFVVLLTGAPFALCYFVLFVCSIPWLFLLCCQYQYKWSTGKTRLQN